VTNDKVHPCLKRLDADCFRAQPAWAKQAFAYRIVHLLTPKALTKRLPKGLRRALLAPGVVMPPGVDMPPGLVVGPAGDIPAGWTPGDPLPPGAIPLATAPPGVEESGAAPPTYTEVGGPGPPHPGIGPSPPGAATVTITSSNKDGHIRNNGDNWNTVRTAATGKMADDNDTSFSNAMFASFESNIYTLWRSFFYFDLTDIPTGKTVTAVSLLITQYTNHLSSVCVQEGTQAATLTTADFDSFTGAVFSTVEWDAGENELVFNAAGLQYIQDQLGETALLCCRESDYDVSGDAPGAGEWYSNGCYYSEAAEANRPKLRVTYK